MPIFPKFVEDSRIPALLSKVGPIEISAISLGMFVFSRGKISAVTRQHESIHYLQWRELGFVLFPPLYGWFYLRNRLRGLSPQQAYLQNPFEREAYTQQSAWQYLQRRHFLAWLDFL